MTAPVTASERDLRALAGIVSEDRPDLPDGEGLLLSLLAELMGQIRCDTTAFQGFDCQPQKTWFVQAIPDPDYAWHEENDPVHWRLVQFWMPANSRAIIVGGASIERECARNQVF